MRSFSFLLVSVILCFVGCYGQVVQTIGQELGLSLLDGLLRRSKERMALTALKRQIEIYEKVDPQSAKLLKNVPTETMVGMIVDSQENQSPATGNPFLNILAKNGIVVNGQASKADNESQQGFPVAEVVQGLVRNFIQTVKPSVMTDPIAGSFFTGPSGGGDSNFPFAVVGLPQRPAGPGPAPGPLSFLPLLGGGLQESNSGGVTAPPPDPFAGISDLGNESPAQAQLQDPAPAGEQTESVENVTTTVTLARTTAPTPQAFKQAVQESVTPTTTTVGTTTTRRPIGGSRLNELNRRANRLTTDRPYYKLQNGSGIRPNRLQPSVTIRPVNGARPELKAGPIEQSVPIDPAMPSVHSMMLMNTWQSLSENEKKNLPVKPSPAEAYFGRYLPEPSGPVRFETTETKSHSALKASTNVSKYRQRSMNVQLPGGRTAGLGDHGLSRADVRGSLTVPKNWISGHRLGGQMETDHFNDASAFFDFFTSAEDYSWPQAEGQDLYRRNALPNFVASHVQPYFIRGLNIPLQNDAYKGGILLGKANRIPAPPADAFRTLTLSDGSKILIPKGIYYRRSFRTAVGGDLATPNFQHPDQILGQFGNISGALKEEEKIHSGFYLPMPFGLRPVALEFVSDGTEQNKRDFSLGVRGLNRKDKNAPLSPGLSVLDNVEKRIFADGNVLARLNSSLRSEDFMRRLGDSLMPTVLQSLDSLKYPTAEPLPEAKSDSEAEVVWQNVKDAILNQPNPFEVAKLAVERDDFSRQLTTNLMEILIEKLMNNDHMNNDETSSRRDNLPVSNINSENREKSIGIVMSAPGVDPIYLGGFLDHARSERKR
ncbi:Macrophage colony-stimulating factor 1 receptor [Trichinella pseudospiralis]